MKHKIILLLLLSGAFLIFTQSAPPPPPSDSELIASYEQNPPVPLHYWVQLLDDSLEDGSNMIMRIEYEEGVDMPESLNIYYNADNAVTFHDDGRYPDSAAGDRIYAAYVQEDTAAFENQIKTLEAQMYSDSTLTHYYGHAAKTINTNSILSFDNNGFHGHHQVEIYVSLLDISNCNDAILKQNSLFITDLSVVEDPARTFNVASGTSGTGNPVGVWTFGNLIKNIANPLVTGVSVKTFLKEWVRGWVSGRNINGQNVPARKDVLRYLIGPWLQKCNSSLGSNYYNVLADNYILNSTNQWEIDWDSPAISESDLLKYAPFKLMAIVNRIDLMGNLGYANNINNAGETRFIYTLEAPFALTSSTGVQTPAGFPPRNGDGAGNNICVNPIDWEGMNVIIEYGNPFTNACQLWNYQYDWYQLSRLTLGSPEYNTALEAITHKVIDANVAPNKPNKSALDQIRTNERIFFESGCPFNQFQDNWSKSDWELSQFELNSSNHLLLPAAVSNTPMNTANVPWYLLGTNNLSTAGTGMGFYNLVSANNNQGELLDPSQYHGSTALLEWVFAHKSQVKLGKHNLPNSFSYGYSLDNGYYTGSDHFDKAATALMDAEQVHYWDLAWYNSPTDHYYNIYGTLGNYEIDKDVRQQLSLNTCHGCHGGETKTNFTMVRPLPYGQAANYWGETPNGPDGKFPVDKRKLDTRFVKTKGLSKVVDPNGPTYDNYPLPTLSDEQYFTRVSPFITGRNYSGAGTWQDDLISDGVTGMNATQIEIAATADDQTDQNFENPPQKNLFFVFDPANYESATYPGPNRVNGYNELDKRKGILCQFLNTDCHNEGSGGGKGQGVIFSIMEKTSFMPLPYRGH